MATSPSDEPESLYSQDELVLLKRVERSRVWRVIRDALCYRREELFNEEPSSSDRLWANRGAIQEIQRLLRMGPALVVIYQRYMAANAKGDAPAIPTERWFDPTSSPRPDPPQFDM